MRHFENWKTKWAKQSPKADDPVTSNGKQKHSRSIPLWLAFYIYSNNLLTSLLSFEPAMKMYLLNGCRSFSLSSALEFLGIKWKKFRPKDISYPTAVQAISQLFQDEGINNTPVISFQI
jgi:hypothetical protein